MKNTTTLIILGIVIALLPFAGLPGAWRDGISIILGLAVATIVYLYTRKERKHNSDNGDA